MGGWFRDRNRAFVCALALLVGSAGSATAQPFLVADINDGPGDGLPFPLYDNSGHLLFGAVDGVGADVQLWRSDGSDSGTTLVRAFDGVPGTFPGPFFVVGGEVLFGVFADSAASCREIWKTDGTESGTVQVYSGCPTTSATLLTAEESGGQLFFVADDAASGRELWVSDGTAVGTQLVLDINPGTEDGLATTAPFATVQAGVLFIADDGTGEQVWISDGSPGGTVAVSSLGTGASVDGLVRAGDLAFFYADDGGRALWRTDGTAIGTVRLGDWGGGFNTPGVLGTEVFFNSPIFSGPNGARVELWKSDGTAGGTSMVISIDQGPNPLASRWRWTESNGLLFFAFNSGALGDELWVTDGTAGGTRNVADIFPGTDSGRPDRMADVRGILYFTADDGTTGAELWQSDGTAAGTTQVADITAGAGSSFPMNLNTQFVESGRHMFFQAQEPSSGIELWAIELDDAPPGADAGVNPGGDGGIDPGGDDDGGCGCTTGGGPSGSTLFLLALAAALGLRRRDLSRRPSLGARRCADRDAALTRRR